MKRVLWISRHPMTQAQLTDLERAMSGPVRLVAWTDTVENVEDLLPALEEVDAAAAVLPTELLARLLELAGEKPVLLAQAGRIFTGRWLTRPDGRRERETAYVHQGWKRLLELRVRTEIL